MRTNLDLLLDEYKELVRTHHDILGKIITCFEFDADHKSMDYLEQRFFALQEIQNCLVENLFDGDKRISAIKERQAKDIELSETTLRKAFGLKDILYVKHGVGEEALYESIPIKVFTVKSFYEFEASRLDEYYGVIGILFADYDNIPVKEYIANEMMLLNSKSADYIDFMFPGYSYGDAVNNEAIKVDNVTINGRPIYFNKEDFSKSVIDYRNIYGLDYLDKPVLILHELNGGQISPRRIILELEYKEVKGLFDKIVTIAREHTDLSDFSIELQKKYIFCMFPKFLKLIISTFIVDIDELKTTTEGVLRFRIKEK